MKSALNLVQKRLQCKLRLVTLAIFAFTAVILPVRAGACSMGFAQQGRTQVSMNELAQAFFHT